MLIHLPQPPQWLQEVPPQGALQVRDGDNSVFLPSLVGSPGKISPVCQMGELDFSAHTTIPQDRRLDIGKSQRNGSCEGEAGQEGLVGLLISPQERAPQWKERSLSQARWFLRSKTWTSYVPMSPEHG